MSFTDNLFIKKIYHIPILIFTLSNLFVSHISGIMGISSHHMLCPPLMASFWG